MKRIVSMTVALMIFVSLLSPYAHATQEEDPSAAYSDVSNWMLDELHLFREDLTKIENNKDRIFRYIRVHNYFSRHQAEFYADEDVQAEAQFSTSDGDTKFRETVARVLPILSDLLAQLPETENFSEEDLWKLALASKAYKGLAVDISSNGGANSSDTGDIELIANLLYDYDKIVAETGTSPTEMLWRMFTYETRLKIFANSATLPYGTATNMDGVRKDTETNDSRIVLSAPIITTDRITNIANSIDYVHFIETANELTAFQVILGSKLIPILKEEDNPPLSEVATYIAALERIKKGLDYVASPELQAIWEEPILGHTEDEANSSLAKIYTTLTNLNAFVDLKKDEEADIAEHPWLGFFDVEESSRSVSRDILYGMSLSSKYIPMLTNVYDPYVLLSADDQEWVENFHRYYGFHRKALYIDTSADAATRRTRVNQVGSTRVATLKDLLFPEAEIVLYIDDNFYNVKRLAELQDKAFDRLDNVDEESREGGFWDNIGNWFRETFTVDIIEITKTAEKSKYSTAIANFDLAFNGYLLDTETIAAEIATDEYSVMQSFAFLSATYRDEDVYSFLNEQADAYHPVFVSSPNIAYMAEATQKDRNSIFNYLLLKNLEAMMPVDYAVNIDINAPLFMDIYGNILTESGLVVVPAAANATLHTDAYSPLNAALFTAYGRDYTLPYTGRSHANETLERAFAHVDNEWRVKQIRMAGGSLDTTRLSTMESEVLEELRELYTYDLSTGIVDTPAMIFFVSEVLRGAPIESIDYDSEGINPVRRLNKSGLLVAQKLEDLLNAIGSKDLNATLALPNLAFIDGLEYIVLFAYKILVLGVIVIWMITIYTDAVQSRVSWKTFGKCLGTVILTLALIVAVPACFDITYYQSNKLLLQDETEYLMMLNLEKQNSGVEIGVSSMDTPDISTELYLKLDDIKMNWYDLMDDIMLSSTFAALEEVYKDYNEQNLIAGFDGIETMNDGVYIATDTLFESSSVDFSPTRKTVYQTVVSGTPASFYTPYYAFLDSVLGSVNRYNRNNNIYSYTTKIQSLGRVKTLGIVAPYFTSKEFMEEEFDLFDLTYIYNLNADSVETMAYDPSMLEYLQNSHWCNLHIGEDEIMKRIEKLDEYAKDWIARNRHLIGKITDETFLKSFVLSCAIEHNKLFGTLKADAIEIYNLSNEDLLRLSMEDETTVMRHSPSSFARFVYDTAGTPGVYAAAILSVVTFVSSWVKPLVTLVVFALTFISIFVFKMLLRRESQNLYGYAVTIGTLCSVNILHSLMLKLSMYLPNWGLEPVVCIILQILIQLAYMVILLWVVTVAAKDWRNMGFTKHQHVFNRITGEFSGTHSNRPTQRSGWDYYNMLVDRQKKRVRRL